MNFTKRNILPLLFQALLLISFCGCNEDEIKSYPQPKNYASGYYDGSISLQLTPSDSTIIFYTLDGSSPTKSSLRYAGPIKLGAIREKPDNISAVPTTPIEGRGHLKHFIWKEPDEISFYCHTIRYAEFINEKQIGKAKTRTFFISKDSLPLQFPIASITTNKDHLIGYKNGILIPGHTFDSLTWENLWWPPGNYLQKKEFPCNVSFFTPNCEPVINQNAGLRVHGGTPGSKTNKSLRLSFRKKYGTKKLICNGIFNRDSIGNYKRLILRNSGDDFKISYFLDGMLHEVAFEMGLTTQNYAPYNVFVNGEYFGILNLREKYDKHYLKSHFNIDKDSIEIVSNYGRTKNGFHTEFNKLKKFMETKDLAIDSNYKYVASLFDIENFVDYFIFQTYVGNDDWPGNNWKLWRNKNGGGKWQNLIYDLDNSFGKTKPADFNTFEYASEANSKMYQNKPGSTLFIRSLLANDQFKKLFLKRVNYLTKHHLNHITFSKKINEFYNLYKNDIGYHIKRWNYPESIDQWKENIDSLKRFSLSREKVYKNFLEGIKK